MQQVSAVVSSLLLLVFLVSIPTPLCAHHATLHHPTNNHTKPLGDPSDCVPTLSCSECTLLQNCGFCYMDGQCAPAAGANHLPQSGACYHQYPPIPGNQWDWHGSSCAAPPAPYKPQPPPVVNVTLPFQGSTCETVKFPGFDYDLYPFYWFNNINNGIYSGTGTLLNSNTTIWFSHGPCMTMDNIAYYDCGKDQSRMPAYACMGQSQPTVSIVIASAIKTEQANTTWSMIDPTNPFLGIRATFQNGANALLAWSCPTTPIFHINYYCNPWGDPNYPPNWQNGDVTFTQIDNCTFTAQIRHVFGCPTNYPPGPPDASPLKLVTGSD